MDILLEIKNVITEASTDAKVIGGGAAVATGGGMLGGAILARKGKLARKAKEQTDHANSIKLLPGHKEVNVAKINKPGIIDRAKNQMGKWGNKENHYGRLKPRKSSSDILDGLVKAGKVSKTPSSDQMLSMLKKSGKIMNATHNI